ncbi:hypothetical protein [Comamonas sp.]|uniref:hypothetical protein n=1 Tax=Comamonas sp. TaxID=34028 RepID=UPI0028972123|nr:hypothetical protein [Comamonas sp.]
MSTLETLSNIANQGLRSRKSIIFIELQIINDERPCAAGKGQSRRRTGKMQAWIRLAEIPRPGPTLPSQHAGKSREDLMAQLSAALDW